MPTNEDRLSRQLGLLSRQGFEMSLRLSVVSTVDKYYYLHYYVPTTKWSTTNKASISAVKHDEIYRDRYLRSLFLLSTKHTNHVGNKCNNKQLNLSANLQKTFTKMCI